MSEPSPEQLLRLDRPGPRYTSYPTAPSWRADYTDAEYHAALTATAGPVSVYVHIPFCREQCTFCGCNMVVSRRQSAGDRYVEALERQLAALPLSQGRLDTVRLHFGGGTPTWLSEAQLSRLFNALQTRFHLVDGAECSVEIDPDVTSDAQIDLLAARGVNRLSLGVQSFDERVLEAINRPQRPGRIHQLMALGRAHGMRGMNVDLVYGLPYQTTETLAHTLDQMSALEPDRMAVYSYAHLPWLKRHMQLIDESTLPGPQQKMAMFLQARRHFLDRGYVTVGMDHFAKEDDELAIAARAGALHRNFMGYTTLKDTPLIGLGVSAISQLHGVFAQQQHHLGAWYRAIVKGEPQLIVKGMDSSPEDLLRAEVIAELMCNFAVDIPAIEASFGVRFTEHFSEAMDRLIPLESEGLVKILPHREAPTRIQVTALGALLVRNVAMCFDTYLKGSKARFSRTV